MPQNLFHIVQSGPWHDEQTRSGVPEIMKAPRLDSEGLPFLEEVLLKSKQPRDSLSSPDKIQRSVNLIMTPARLLADRAAPRPPGSRASMGGFPGERLQSGARSPHISHMRHSLSVVRRRGPE